MLVKVSMTNSWIIYRSEASRISLALDNWRIFTWIIGTIKKVKVNSLRISKKYGMDYRL